MNRTIFSRVAALIALALSCGVAAAADYGGNYEGAGLIVLIKPDGANYNGEVRTEGRTYPLTAHEDGNHLAGAYLAGGKAIPFTATQQGDELIVLSGDFRYQLRRQQNPVTRPANPLAAQGAAPAPGAATQSAEPLANYVVITETAAGR